MTAWSSAGSCSTSRKAQQFGVGEAGVGRLVVGGAFDEVVAGDAEDVGQAHERGGGGPRDAAFVAADATYIKGRRSPKYHPLHVGFDLYMYVGSARHCPRGSERASESGFFVEDGWSSPQLATCRRRMPP